MPTPKVKILVFMLARRGCIAYANEMCKDLQHSPIELKIYASRFCEEPLLSTSVLVPTFRNSIEFLWRTLFSLPVLLWKMRQDVKKGYQIIYFPMFHHWNPALLWFAKWWGAKTFLTVHDAVFHLGEWQFGQAFFQKMALPLAHQIIVLSAFVKSQLSLTLQQRTIVVTHPLLSITQKNSIRKHTTRPSILFLGRIARYKGIDLLLEALKDFKNEQIAKLTIAGMPMYEPGIPVTDFPIQTIKRWLSDTEIEQLLAIHNILVLPYREASQSGVVTLGIAATIPMVVTKVGGLREQLTTEEAIWVEPTLSSIREGILQLIEQPDLYQSLHQNLQVKYQKLKETSSKEQLYLLFLRFSQKL